MERSRSFFVTLGAAFPLRGTASIFSEIDMFDMIGYWGSATAACFSHKPKAKKPYVFILSRRLEEAVVGAICHHTIVAYLTQKEFEDGERLKTEIIPAECAKLGWDPDLSTAQEELPLRHMQLQRLRQVLGLDALSKIILRYPHSQNVDDYSVVNVDGVAWRYKHTSNAVICAPTHIEIEAFVARLEFDALQAKAA